LWVVYTKSHQYRCAGGEWHGNWIGVMGGGYTMAGSPYVSSIADCSGIPGYACGGGVCEASEWTCASGCVFYLEREVKLAVYYPEPYPGGEECCD
jgi:hypothetical protein